MPVGSGGRGSSIPGRRNLTRTTSRKSGTVIQVIRNTGHVACLTCLLATSLFAQCSGGGVVTVGTATNSQATNCIQTNGTFTVTGTAPVYYQAGATIYLNPGFTAQAGSSGTAFIASIGPVITTTSLPSGTIGTPYPATSVSASEGSRTGPFVWSGTGLPPGLTLNAGNGVIAGTPTTAGIFSPSIVAKDASGSSSLAASPTITVVSSLTVTTSSLAGGVVTAVYSQTLSASGGFPPYSNWQQSGTLPPGLSLDPSTGTIAGTPTTAGTYNFSTTVKDNAGVTSLSFSLGITVSLPPNPLISLESVTCAAGISISGPITNGSGGCASATNTVWGTADLRGYALENAPLAAGDKISRVSVLISSNDDFGFALSDSALYGTAVRNDICGASKAYPGGTDCPRVQFDYLWQTGATSATAWTNGSYSTTLTAFDSSSPLASTPATATFTVDNQPPSPVISSPVNGSGIYGVSQPFTILYVSPHNNLDFGQGQVVFSGESALTCTVQWSLGGGGGVFLVTDASGHSPCTLDTTKSQLSNNGTNELTLKLWVTFPQAMAGTLPQTMAAVLVQANGSTAAGDSSGPLSTLTYFTVLQMPGVPPIPQPFAVTSVAQLGGQATFSQTLYVVDPSLGAVTASFPGGGCSNSNGVQINGVWQGSSGWEVSASTPIAHVTTVTATYTANDSYNESYLQYPILCLPQYVYIFQGNALIGTGRVNIYVNNRAVSVNTYTGGGLTLTQSGPGSSGTVNVTPGALGNPPNPDGISAGTAQNGVATIAVTNPSLPPGVYAVRLLGLSNFDAYAYQYATIFVTVTAVSSPDISAGPISPVSLAVNSSTTFSVDVSPVNGFAGHVSLAKVSETNTAPIGLTFSPSSLDLSQGPATATATIAAQTGTPVASYPVHFTVSDSAASPAFVTHIVTVTTKVQGGPPTGYTALASPTAVSLKLGQSTTGSLVLTAGPGYAGTLTASITNVSSGLSVGFAGSSQRPQFMLTGGSSQSAQINISASLPISQAGCGTCSFVLSVTGGNQAEQDVAVPVAVSPPDPLLTVTDVWPQPDAKGNYSIGQQIYFIRHTPDNAVGTETFQWVATNWSLPPGLAPGTNSVTFKPTASGYYCAQFTVTDQLGRTAPPAGSNASIACILVAAGLGVTINGASSTSVGGSVNLTAQASGGSGHYTYAWSSNTAIDPNNPNDQSKKIFSASSSSTPVQVFVTVTDTSTSNTATGSLAITVYNPVTVTISGVWGTSVGQTLALQAVASGGSGTGYTYSWTGAAPNRLDTSRAIFNASSPPSQTVTVQVADGSGNSGSQSASINIAPGSALAVALSARATVSFQSSTALSATGSNGSGSYSYTWGGAGVIPAAQGSNHATFTALSATGAIPVQVTITDTANNNTTSTTGTLINVVPKCGTVPSRQYVRLGTRVVAVENTACAP